MRNYRKGEVVLTSFGRLFRLTETPACGLPWIACVSMPEGEEFQLRESTIVGVVELQPEVK